MMSPRIRRSLLYVPGWSEAMVRKAATRGADTLILDLEDGVAPEAKDRARDAVERFLQEVDFGSAEVLVRVNQPSSPWGGKDLDMLRRARPQGVLVPKIEDPQTAASLDQELGGATPLFLMIETVKGAALAAPIAHSSPRVSGLVFGAADYRESLRAGRLDDEGELLFARFQILQAARMAGIEAFDTPWFEYRDTGGLRQSAWRVRQLGFEGKCAIHPVQVPIINQVFAPTRQEIERARSIFEAMAQAIGQGRYVATVGDEMVEALHLKQAHRILDRAFRLGLANHPPPPVDIPGAWPRGPAERR